MQLNTQSSISNKYKQSFSYFNKTLSNTKASNSMSVAEHSTFNQTLPMDPLLLLLQPLSQRSRTQKHITNNLVQVNEENTRNPSFSALHKLYGGTQSSKKIHTLHESQVKQVSYFNFSKPKSSQRAVTCSDQSSDPLKQLLMRTRKTLAAYKSLHIQFLQREIAMEQEISLLRLQVRSYEDRSRFKASAGVRRSYQGFMKKNSVQK